MQCSYSASVLIENLERSAIRNVYSFDHTEDNWLKKIEVETASQSYLTNVCGSSVDQATYAETKSRETMGRLRML